MIKNRWNEDISWVLGALCFCGSVVASNAEATIGDVDYFNQRFGLNLYISGASDVINRSEIASLSYDVSTRMSVIMGTSIADPKNFQYLDLSLQSPWTFLSWQGSLELGVGRFFDKEDYQNRLSQSVSLDYTLDEFFSLQIMLKRFTKSIYHLGVDERVVAMGIGMRI